MPKGQSSITNAPFPAPSLGKSPPDKDVPAHLEVHGHVPDALGAEWAGVVVTDVGRKAGASEERRREWAMGHGPANSGLLPALPRSHLPPTFLYPLSSPAP